MSSALGAVMVPDTSGHSDRMTRNSDDLPQPFGPVMRIREPRVTSKLRSLTSSVPSGL